MKKDTKFSRSFKYNGISIAFSAIFVAIIVVVNLIVSGISADIPLSLDLTAGNIFEMSQQSKDYLQKIKSDIDITVLMDNKDLQNGGVYYAQAKATLDGFSALNSRIAVSYIDPVANPAFLSKYPDMALRPYDILIQSKDKKVKLSVTDLFNVEYDQYSSQPYIASSKAEQEIVSALLRVTQNVAPQIALLSDCDTQYSEGMVELLEKNGYLVSSKSIGELASLSDADVAFLVAPKRDLDQVAIEKLDDFLTNGGRYGRSLYFAPSPVAVPQPNLEAFLAQWGIAMGDGLVLETSSDKILNNAPYFCIVDYAKDDYTEALGNAPVVSPLGRDIKLLFKSQSSYITETLLAYSDSSFVMPVSADSSWNPSKSDLGSRPSLIRSTYSQYSGMAALQSKVFVFASSAFFDTSVLGSTSVLNSEYLLSALSDATNRADTISIAPKNLDLKELVITQTQFMATSFAFIIVLPLAILAVGATICLRRKNK